MGGGGHALGGGGGGGKAELNGNMHAYAQQVLCLLALLVQKYKYCWQGGAQQPSLHAYALPQMPQQMSVFVRLY